MTPAALARIRRLAQLRAAQQRIAAAGHARDRAASDAARSAEQDAWREVDDAITAAAIDGATQRVDDLIDARLRVAFLSRVAARRAGETAAADRAVARSAATLRASTLTREQMDTWLGGASDQVNAAQARHEEQRLDELAARAQRAGHAATSARRGAKEKP